MAELPKIDVNLAPKRLTTDQIQDVLSVLPEVRSAYQEAGLVSRQAIIDTLTDQLSEIELTVLAIPDLKEELVRQFTTSLIAPGTPVGVLAAEALGGPVTQMALNSFHTTGASKTISSGVERIKELVNVTQNPKTPACGIFFQDELITYDDVMLYKRGDLVGLVVSSLLFDYEIGSPVDLISDNDQWWYSLFQNVIRSDYGEPAYILRLQMNINTLYAYNTTLEQVVAAIERDKSGTVICVYSPMAVGIIDIYPVERVIQIETQVGMTESERSTFFLSNILLPSLDDIQVKGVEHITGLYPVPLEVLSIITKDIQASPGSNMWLLRLNEARMKTTGINERHLSRLCEVAGITVSGVHQNGNAKSLVVILPDGDDSPSKRIIRLIKEDEKAEIEYENEQRKLGNKFPHRPPTALLKASEVIKADTDGSNLRALLSRDDIDTVHTMCNDVNEILTTLGIEAARNFLISEFSRVFAEEGSYVAPEHISVLVDFMTNQGRLNPITISGIQRQPTGAFTKASSERAMEMFKEAAAFGRIELIASTSSAIYVGKRALVGTGYLDVEIDQKKLQEFKKKIEQEQRTTNPIRLDATQFRDAISRIDALSLGVTPVTLQGANLDEEMMAMFGQTAELVPSIPSIPIVSMGTPAEGAITFKDQPVVSNLLKGVQDTILEAPCLHPDTTSTINIQPIASPKQTLNPGISAPPVIGSVAPVEISVLSPGVGLPLGLTETMKSAQAIKLPTVRMPAVVSRVKPQQRRVQIEDTAALFEDEEL